MPNDKPYLKRKHVILEEETKTGYSLASASANVIRQWVASINAPLSTGEVIQLERSSHSAGGALLLLTEALAEQGWELR